MSDLVAIEKEVMKTELKLIPLDKVVDHPKNPRLVYRQDVIDSIATNLNGEFPKKHAIHVRPVGDVFETTSGHHRKRAAEKAGIKQIWAWVEEMSDEDAFMALATSNAQGELSPLEIGMHALEAVPAEKGGRGKKGGLSEYARAIGQSKTHLSECRSAAETIKPFAHANGFDVRRLLGSQRTLTEIGKLRGKDDEPGEHEDAIPTLVRLLHDSIGDDGAGGWSVADTKKKIEAIRKFVIKPNNREWLPLADVVAEHLKNPRFSPEKVTGLQSLIDAEAELEVQHPDAMTGLREWLVSERPGSDVLVDGTEQARSGDSWDPTKVRAKIEEIKAALNTKLVETSELWLLGKWEDHIPSLEDGSVNLLFTDPPYGMSYQSNFRKKKHKEIEGDADQNAAAKMLKAIYRKLCVDAHLLVFCSEHTKRGMEDAITDAGYEIRRRLVWCKNNWSMGDLTGTVGESHECIIHAVKGDPKILGERRGSWILCDREGTERHPTEKPVELLEHWISVFSAENQLVVDPFGGVASTLVAAQNLGRRFWGCEIEEQYHAIGLKRLTGDRSDNE